MISLNFLEGEAFYRQVFTTRIVVKVGRDLVLDGVYSSGLLKNIPSDYMKVLDGKTNLSDMNVRFRRKQREIESARKHNLPSPS